jgi:hypothetical protein
MPDSETKTVTLSAADYAEILELLRNYDALLKSEMDRVAKAVVR